MGAGNDPFLVTTTTRTHTTDIRRYQTTSKTHSTDIRVYQTVSKAHGTDIKLWRSVSPAHSTDIKLWRSVSPAHSTDTQLRSILTVTITHSTDTRVYQTVSKAHNTDTRVYQTVSKAHSTNTLVYQSVQKAHSTDTWLSQLVTRSITHATDTRLCWAQLVSWWKLDEATNGAVAIDYGWAAANATDTGGTTISTPAPTTFANPNARHLPGAPTYLNAGTPAAHIINDNFTVALWVRPSASLTTSYGLIGRWNNTSGSFGGWVVQNSSTAVQLMVGTGGSASPVNSNAALTIGTWTHVAFKQTSGTRQIYINGIKSGLPTSVAWQQPGPTYPTLLGNTFTAGTPWKGDLDDVRYYNVALTDDQISSLGAGNEPYLVTTSTKTHTTDSYLLLSPIKTHTTDIDLATVVFKTHTTDTRVYQSVQKTHTTDTRVYQTVSKAHSTNTWLSQLGTVVIYHTTDTDFKGSVTWTHTTDTRVYKSVSKAHNTDTRVYQTYSRAHSTDTAIPHTFTVTHSTNSFLKIGIVGSRSRTQRIGTRTLAFNER